MINKSKRFNVLLISVGIFILGMIIKIDVISLATGITILTTPYITMETIRKSDKG